MEDLRVNPYILAISDSTTSEHLGLPRLQFIYADVCGAAGSRSAYATSLMSLRDRLAVMAGIFQRHMGAAIHPATRLPELAWPIELQDEA